MSKIQEEKDNKPRSHRGQVNPKKDDLDTIVSGRSINRAGAGGGGNFV